MRKNKHLLAMVQVALLASITAVLSIVSIPMPTNMPLTLQTFAVALAGYFGGPRKGVASIGVYLALGAAGVPVFSGMRGGIGVMISYTGGFLWGFLLLALLCGLGKERHPIHAILLGIGGLVLCHICGVLQYAAAAEMGLVKSFVLVSLPYLLKDILSVAGAMAAAAILKRSLIRAGLEVQ